MIFRNNHLLESFYMLNRYLKFLFISFAMIAQVNLCAQTITGLGKIRLESSFKDVKALFPKSLIKITTTNKSQNVKVYKINSYTPIKNHTCRDIHLYFYKDTLYSIYVNNAPDILCSSLTQKYGEPKKKYVRFNSYAEEIVSIFMYDAADFIVDSKIGKSDIMDTFASWNEDNPFADCCFIECLYEKPTGGGACDNIFYIRNNVVAKIVLLEEQIKEEEINSKRINELEGL